MATQLRLTRPAGESHHVLSRAAHGRMHVGLMIIDIILKLALVDLLILVALNPTYGNLEGKAPVTRAVTYPILAFALPIVWHLRSAPLQRQFPWAADVLVTLSCFSDILGNRLDLYDSVLWFDDWMHFMNTGMLSAAAVLLTLPVGSGLVPVMERAVATGLTISLAWEVFEYLSFVLHSPELSMAYEDTLGDLVLGWAGAVVAGAIVHACRRHQPRPGSSRR